MFRFAQHDSALSGESLGRSAANAVLQPFQKERAFGFRFREFKGPPELFGSCFTIVQSHLKLADYGIEQVIRF